MNVGAVYSQLDKNDREIIIDVYTYWKIADYPDTPLNTPVSQKSIRYKGYINPTHATLAFFDLEDTLFMLSSELDEVVDMISEDDVFDDPEDIAKRDALERMVNLMEEVLK